MVAMLLSIILVHFVKSCDNDFCSRASYFIMEVNLPPLKIDDVLEQADRDVDIVRGRIFRKKEPEYQACTLEEELQPPPYRKNVQDLVKQARSLDKPRFEHNTGLDYYPFQK